MSDSSVVAMLPGPLDALPAGAAAERGCSVCGLVLSVRARFCRRCGARQVPSAEVLDPAMAAGDTRPCPRCDTPLSAAARFCRSCGRRQRAQRVPVPPSRVGLVPLPAAFTVERTLDGRQRRAFAAVGLVLLLCLQAFPVATLVGLVAVATALYLAAFLFRMRTFSLSLRAPGTLVVSDEEARAIRPSELPTYTVLVPLFREPEVMSRLLASLGALEYPVDKLDIKLLLEEDDEETIRAAVTARPAAHIELVRVPFSLPRTKPKACDHGLRLARGEQVTIFDAEDRPDPLQLRRAAAAFRRLPPRVACLQSKLSYHNADQNLITRWFTAEYAMWFAHLLPGLVRQGAPIPLGGTSNHFRRGVLDAVGAWDAYNVTEDADLGIRLSRFGYRTLVLESTTYEEANSDFVNWVKQRSRWYKGYLQTWLVHMRRPRQLWRQLGPAGFLTFNLFVGGTPLLALINPLFWAMTLVWFLAHPAGIQAIFPWWLYYLGLTSFALGNLGFLYTMMLSARATGRPSLVLAALVAPLYWVMMSIAAIKALIQLLSAPSFWEKTTHGLDMAPASTRHATL